MHYRYRHIIQQHYNDFKISLSLKKLRSLHHNFRQYVDAHTKMQIKLYAEKEEQGTNCNWMLQIKNKTKK